MSDEGFLRRWARLKSSGGDSAAAQPRASAPALSVHEAAPAARPEAETEIDTAPRVPLPTLEDAARLTPDADFTAFVAQGVDKAVQRLALKKLFADPHFHAIDGLDMYMSDYNKAAPLAPGMLASLKHAPGVLSRLLGEGQQEPPAATASDAPAQEQEQGQEEPPPSTRQGKA